MSVTTVTFSEYPERNFEGTPCRLCMKKNSDYFNIFTSNISSTMTVEDAIQELVGLTVAVEDGLPTTVCPLCLNKLTEFNDFKKICMESDSQLRNILSRNFVMNIQGERTADDELGSSAETKDFIPDAIIGASQLSRSVQVTEIYIPVPDCQLPGANMLEERGQLGGRNCLALYAPDPAQISSDVPDPLAIDDLFHVKEESKDHFGKDSYPVRQPTDPAGISRDVSETLASDDLSDVKEENQDHFGEESYSVLHTPPTPGIMSGVSDPLVAVDLPQASTSSQGGEMDAEDTGTFVIDLDCLLVDTKREPSPEENDDTEPLFMENGEPDLNRTVANDAVMGAVELRATDTVPSKTTSTCYLLAERNVKNNQRANCIASSASFSLLEPKTRASYSEKGRKVMNKDMEKCGAPLADKIASSSIPDDGQFLSKSRHASKISGTGTNLSNDTNVSPSGSGNGNSGTKAVMGRNSERSPSMIKNPGKRTRSKDNSPHCFNCGDVFNAKNDLIEHLKIHSVAGNLKVNANSSIDKDLSIKTLESRRKTNGSSQPTSSKSLNQLSCERQGVRQKRNGLVKEISGGKRKKKNMRQVSRNLLVDRKSCTDSPRPDKKPYSCSECEKSFSYKCYLVYHMYTHSEHKPYSCNECEKSFSRKSHLAVHMHTHSGLKPYSCNLCEKSFSCGSNLAVHTRLHTGVKPYSCHQCEKTFSQKCNLVCHIRTHTKETPYSCSQCGKSFAAKNNLLLHKRTHTGVKPYSCSICSKSFSRSHVLTTHMQTHTKAQRYSCNECEKSYTSKQNLVAHKRTHTGEKPFQCSICRKSFTKSNFLNMHMRTHTKEKPYSCNECKKSFSQKTHLVQHLYTHTGVKPYACDECGKTFSEKSRLVVHIRAHSGMKPYSCDHCEKAFMQKISLVRHMHAHMQEI